MTSRDDDSLAPPTYDELDHSDPWRPPYTGPRADHVASWGCCDLPLTAHPEEVES